MTVCGSTAATERNGPFSFSFLLFSAKFVFFYTWTDTLDETVGPAILRHSTGTHLTSHVREFSSSFLTVSLDVGWVEGGADRIKTSGRINKKKILLFFFDEFSSGTKNRERKKKKTRKFKILFG
jgi:hypothetical protein